MGELIGLGAHSLGIASLAQERRPPALTEVQSIEQETEGAVVIQKNSGAPPKKEDLTIWELAVQRTVLAE